MNRIKRPDYLISQDRIQILNSKNKAKGDYVLYGMQASQRTEYNHALERAISIANESSLPLILYLGIKDNFLAANLRYYRFRLAWWIATQMKFSPECCYILILPDLYLPMMQFQD